MSLLYKDSKDVTIAVSLALIEGKIVLDFSSDCGKCKLDKWSPRFPLPILR